jgi:hypothetical protein
VQAGLAGVPEADGPGAAGAADAGAGVLDFLVKAGVAGAAGLPVCAGHASGASAKQSSAAAATRCFEDMATM